MATDRAQRLARLQTRVIGVATGTMAVAGMVLFLGGPIRSLVSPPPAAPTAPVVASFGVLNILTGKATVIDPDGVRRTVTGKVSLSEGMRIVTQEGAVAEIRVGDGVRMILMEGTDIRLDTARVTADGRVEVDAALEEGLVFTSVRATDAGTRLLLRAQERIFEAEDAEFVIRSTAEGIVLDVLQGEVTSRDLEGNMVRIRQGERFDTTSEAAIPVTVISKEDMEILKGWVPQLEKRMVMVKQPDAAPTPETRKEHEDYLRDLILQSAKWFVEDQHRYVLGLVSDPFRIMEKLYPRIDLIIYLEQLVSRHEIIEIEIDREEIFFAEWKEDYPGFFTTKAFLDGSMVAVEYEDRDTEESPELRMVTCEIKAEFGGFIRFEYGNGEWKATAINMDFLLAGEEELGLR